MSQTITAIEQTIARPLTTLSEDEQMFRASVREFAEGELRKRVESMDEHGQFDPELIRQCFELGLMGIETPEEFGGAGGTFFQAILAVEELSRVDASVGVLVDVQNTLVNNALIRWGTISAADLSLFHIADTPDEAFTYLTRELSSLYGDKDAESPSV